MRLTWRRARPDPAADRRRTRFGRRSADNKLPRILRDFWQVLLTLLVLLALSAETRRQHDLCRSANAVRQQLNERAQLTPVKIGRRVVVLPVSSADLLKLSAALTHTRQQEARAFAVFGVLGHQAGPDQVRTVQQRQALKVYLKTIGALVGDYRVAARLDAQVRDNLLRIQYQEFPILRCK